MQISNKIEFLPDFQTINIIIDKIQEVDKMARRADDGLLHAPERDGYMALLLAILKGYTATQALKFIKKR